MVSELGLSEMVFVKWVDVEVVGVMVYWMYDIWWFMLKCEINLCGYVLMVMVYEIFWASGNEYVIKIGFLYGKSRDVCDGI